MKLPPTIEALCETSEGRGKVVTSALNFARHKMEFAIGKRRRWGEYRGGYSVRSVLETMELVGTKLQEGDPYDRVAWASTLGDLRALLEEQCAVWAQIKPSAVNKEKDKP